MNSITTYFRWDNTDATEARMYLRKSVYACLSECDRYQIKSVAIPAISCGVFGGKPKDCIPVIVRAIKRYFTHKTVKSFVQEVSVFRIYPMLYALHLPTTQHEA